MVIDRKALARHHDVQDYARKSGLTLALAVLVYLDMIEQGFLIARRRGDFYVLTPGPMMMRFSWRKVRCRHV